MASSAAGSSPTGDRRPTASTPTTSATDQDYGARTFYEFRLTSSGRPGPLTRLAMSVPSGQQVNGLALSPDGSKLAMALQPETNKQPYLTLLKVYTLATGAVRTWTGNGWPAPWRRCPPSGLALLPLARRLG